MNNIILIGMPGAGKSTIGIVLAKVLGYEFIDSDILIQKAERRCLWEIIEQDGLEAFQAIENKINSEISAAHSVISPGGSVVYGAQAMEHLKSIGTVIYLDVNYDLIEQRVGNLDRRGVVHKSGETLRHLYDERVPLYKKYADITIHEEDDNISNTVAAILKALGIVKQ